MTKVKYLSRSSAEEYLKSYCELVHINYCNDFLTKDSYGVSTSESFPGLKAMEGIRSRIEASKHVDEDTLQSTLWVIVKYICSIQMYDIIEKDCSFYFGFNKAVYCISYLYTSGKLPKDHYDMLLPIFNEEYKHRVLEILCKFGYDKLPLEKRLIGLNNTDNVFGCYSPLFIANARDNIEHSILDMDKHFINNRLLASMFLDTLDAIIDKFYINNPPSSLEDKVREAYEHDLICCLKTSRRVNVVKNKLLASNYLLNMDNTISSVLTFLRGDSCV